MPLSPPAPGHPDSDHPIPPLPWQRAVLFSLASIGVGMVFTFFNAQLPLYLRDYGMAHQWIGPLTNERSLAGALVLPIVGRMSDRARTRWGKRRPFFLAGAPLLAAALVALGLRPPFPIMLTLVLAAGGFLFIALGPYQAMMADITPSHQRGQVGSMTALAGLVGAVIVSLLAAQWWEGASAWVFAATAAVLLLTFGLTFLLVREPDQHPDLTPSSSPKGRGELDDLTSAAAEQSALIYEDFVSEAAEGLTPPLFAGHEAAELRTPHAVRRTQSPGLGRLRAYWQDVRQFGPMNRYIAAMSLYWLAAGGATPFITLYGTETLHLTANAASGLFLVLVLSTAVGTVGVGLLADRVGKRRMLHGGLALFALAALAASSVSSVDAALPVMVLAGLGNACPTVLAVPLLADLLPPKRAGEFLGLGSAIWSLVQPLGSFLAGSLVDSLGSNRWAFGFAALFMALAVAALFGVPRETRGVSA